MRRGARIYFLFIVHTAPASKSIVNVDVPNQWGSEWRIAVIAHSSERNYEIKK